MYDERYSTTRCLITERPSCFDKSVDGKVTLFKTADCGNKTAEGGLRLKGLFKAGSEEKPLITIITVVYNGEGYLEETIKSVIEQDYHNLEYIIVDGGSKDGTLDIIRKYEHAIDYWVSEPDKGIYDAMNKGVALCSGEWINFMNADDYFCNSSVLSRIDFQDADFIYGNVLMQDDDYFVRLGGKLDLRMLLRSSMTRHQSVFVRRRIYRQLGLFDLNYKIAADYEFSVRVFSNDYLCSYRNVDVACMRMGGVSDISFTASLNEKLAIIRKYAGMVDYMAALVYQYFYERPRNKVRVLLSSIGLLRYWRMIRG